MLPTLSTTDLLALLAAIPLAAIGGEGFLKGILGVATWLRLPKMLVATTLVAFATSSPELTVSSMAALSGAPEIGLGDALGSNVVNIALILGIALLFGALPANLLEIRRDLTLALLTPLLTLILILDGNLSRGEGFLLLALFAAWIGLAIRQAAAHRRQLSLDVDTPGHPVMAWLYVLGGLTCLILAGRLFVSGASGIAVALGIHAYVIGALVVAIGTSLPELMTMLIARWRGHDDVGLGTLLGSNLFNGLAIVGTAASIHPIQAPFVEVGAALVFGIITVLLMLPSQGFLSRQRGLVLLGTYAAFVAATVSL